MPHTPFEAIYYSTVLMAELEATWDTSLQKRIGKY